MKTFSSSNCSIDAQAQADGTGAVITSHVPEVGRVSITLLKEGAPAFALAVLEAAGYTADNSCAGDAVRSLKFQIANEARAAEEAQLDKEAEALARTHWDAQRYLFNWPKETSTFKDLWLNVARKARELHKPEASK